MTKTRHMIACAPIAIAAMAALHTPAAMAQETPTIVLDVPATAPVTSPAPTVLPAPTPAPIAIELPQPEPVVEPPVVEEAAPVATTQTTRAAARQAPAPVAAPVATSESTTSAPDATQSELPTSEVLATTATSDSTQPAATEMAPVQNPVNDTSGAALLFALLGLGGVGLAAFLLFRTRRRRREEDVPVIEQPIVAATPVMEREPAVSSYDAEPVRAMPVEPSRPVAASNGAAVELPAEPPRNPAERDRLLQRMIEAKPDRANPFASHKARAKRARLILQSLGTRFTDRKPSIDLSQYTNVWPELRGWRPATA